MPPLPAESHPFFGEAGFSERLSLPPLLDRPSYPRSFFSFFPFIPLFLFALTCFLFLLSGARDPESRLEHFAELIAHVVGKGSTPWYLLTSEPVETEADAWKVVMAYARRWQIELTWKTCKSELGMQSPRVWDWETRLKLLGLATLAYAFLLHLLSTPFQLVRRWLLRYAAHRSGRRLRATRVPLARVRLALSRLWLAYPPRWSRRARPALAVS